MAAAAKPRRWRPVGPQSAADRTPFCASTAMSQATWTPINTVSPRSRPAARAVR